MMPGLPVIEAELYGRLPEALHWRGEPNDWVRMTRPGMRLHSFLEGPVSTTMAPSGWSMCRMDGFSKSTRAAIGLLGTPV